MTGNSKVCAVAVSGGFVVWLGQTWLWLGEGRGWLLTAQRSNVAIYPFDPCGLVLDQYAVGSVSSNTGIPAPPARRLRRNRLPRCTRRALC